MAQPQATEADLIDLYRSDLGRYATDNLVIRTKAAALKPFVFNRAQNIVHSKLSTQLKDTGRVRAIVLKARQEGISTYTAARFYRRVQMYEQQSALVIADQRKRGQTLFQIYELFDKKLPEWILPEKRWQRRGWSLHYDNVAGTGLNSQLLVETAKDATAGRGSTIQAVHASELGFWENPEESWTALMQAVPDLGSEVIVESTANGVGNMFWQLWQDAEAGDSTFIPIFLPWWIHEEYERLLSVDGEAEIRDTLTTYEKDLLEEGLDFEGVRVKLELGQIAWRRSTIRDKLNGDENLFRQEYPATAREAFLVSGNCFFDEDALLEYEMSSIAPKRERITMVGTVPTRFPAARGELRTWENPRIFDRSKPKDVSNEDGEYVIFVDTATGKMSSERETIYASDREQGGRDFSCAWVYDVRRSGYVACLHARLAPELFAEKCYALGYLYSSPNRRTGNRIPALLGVERNHSSGETVVRKLNDMGYPNLFRDRTMNTKRDKMTVSLGWVTTESKRIVMLDEFSAELRAHGVKLPDADTIRECFTFIRGETGKPEAQEGCHDDRVIAAAGCLQVARHHHVPAVTSSRTPVRRGGQVGHLEYEERKSDAVK